MRLGIMQPYFFPYIGYFSLIKHSDKFILFDTPQFIRHGWIERNRILKQSGGWQYFSVPLQKHNQKTPINQIMINNQGDWKSKILAQLVHYKKAPYYSEVISVLNEIFKDEFLGIVGLNYKSIKGICEYLDIKTEVSIFSKMGLNIQEANEPDEWALRICQAIEGVDEYWNPEGGIEFFDISKYKCESIDINFQKMILNQYNQKGNEFESGLSIIDVMMFNSKNEIGEMMDKFELLL